MKGSITDRERDKFRPASGDLTKVAVTIEQTTPIPVDVEGITWDLVQASYPNNVTEVYEFLLDSNLVQTITIEYTNSSKKQILSVTKVSV